jgi:predicted Zn-dependent protease
MNNEGAVLEKAGNLQEAMEKYRTALTLDPGHIGIRTNFAAALLRLGQWSQGIGELREALRRDPGNHSLQQALEEALSHAPAGIEVVGAEKRPD